MLWKNWQRILQQTDSTDEGEMEAANEQVAAAVDRHLRVVNAIVSSDKRAQIALRHRGGKW